MGIPFAMTTAYDRPVPALPVPGAVTSGDRQELQLVDGLTRGGGVVGRFDESPALVAVKVAPKGARFRVTVRLAADGDTSAWWERRVPEHVSPRRPHGPRLLAVRSQGLTRGAVLLARRVEDFHLRARTAFTFELSADELPADGFLVVEVCDVADALPAWAAEPLTAHAAVGVRVDAVEIAPATEARAPLAGGGSLDGWTCERLGLVGSGGLPGPGSASIPVRAGFLLVRPPDGIDATLTWTLRPTSAAESRPDPVPAEVGPVLPKRSPGEPRLSTREKAVAVARHELDALRDDVRRRARHVTARGLRRAARPVDRGLAPLMCDDLLARGLLTARLASLDGSEVPACEVSAAPGGRMAVTCAQPLTGPAVLALTACTSTGGPLTRVGGGRLQWHLVSTKAHR